jgi:hypothetical protein
VKRLIIALAFSFFTSSGFSQDALSILQSVLDGVMSSISNGQNPGASGTDLWSIFDLGGGSSSDWSSLGIDFGLGGSGAFGEGGIFNGGVGGRVAGLMGFDEIHNDGSMNSNVTWAIFHTTRSIHPSIRERQEKIMNKQDSINMRIYQLYLLEEKTRDYLSTKQNDAVEIEEITYVLNIANDIKNNFIAIGNLKDKDPAIKAKYDKLALTVFERSARMYLKIQNFARVDGNRNLLNNQNRNAIIIDTVQELRELRGISLMTLKQCEVVQYASAIENAVKMR